MADVPLFASLRGIEKEYGRFWPTAALRSVNLDLYVGERVVIVGPNGAGKSTLLRILLGITQPSRGMMKWQCGDRPRIGFAPEQPRLLSRTTVRECLGLAMAADTPDRLCECAAALDIEYLLDRRTGQLSKGESQRVSLAFAFLTGAPLVVLDEPFEGLDPLIRPLARSFIFSEVGGNANQTLVVTTHRLEEVREPFQRVLILARGNIVQDVSRTDFEQRARGTILVLGLDCGRADVHDALKSRGFGSFGSPIHVVRGTYEDKAAVLAGPLPAEILTDALVRPLNVEALLQLWLQPPLD